VGGGQIHTSADGGVTWTARASEREWFAITTSADGRKLAAVEYGGQIYTSTDTGATWTARGGHRYWQSISSSADGLKLAVGVFGGHIHTFIAPEEAASKVASNFTPPAINGSLLSAT
jgi:photosystem II stability/assembly factor-like uncharacterized protein